MNLSGIATLVVVGGFLLVLFCLAQAEISYRQIQRHLEQRTETENGRSLDPGESLRTEWAVEDRSHPGRGPG